jgi:beta-lactam-binding protein with PASTA domain
MRFRLAVLICALFLPAVSGIAISYERLPSDPQSASQRTRQKIEYPQRSNLVRMPNFVGMRIDLVRQSNGRPSRSGSERPWFNIATENDYSCAGEPGVVTNQDPPPAAPTTNGAKVKLWVGACVIVPPLIGKPVEEANKILTALGLRYEHADARSRDAAPGTIVNQSQRPYTRVRPGTIVQLGVAPARSPDMPDLVGQPIRDVLARLGEAGKRRERGRLWLTIETENDYSCNREPGLIERQFPSRGTPIVPGQRVRLSVAACVIVPNLTGKPVEEAKRVLASLDLRYERAETPRPDAIPETVLSQSQTPGTRVRPGTVIQLTVASHATMPDLLGQNIDQVKRRLGTPRNRGDFWLTIEAENDYSCNLVPGLIERQSAPPGTRVEPGARVRLWVAACSVVPALEGKRVADAGGILGAANLGIATEESPTAGVTPGTILKQSHQPGTRLPPRTVVLLTIASLPRIKVPDVTNQGVADAVSRLESVGLKATGAEETRRGGEPLVVIAQDPAAETLAVAGSEVRLTVSRRPAMPNLVGQTLEAATRHPELRILQDRVETLEDTESRSQPDTVSRQEPPAGTTLTREMKVRLWVAVPLLMPDLVGRRLDAVRADPEVLRLNLEIKTEDGFSLFRESGLITEQSPAPRQRIREREAVTLIVTKQPNIGILAILAAGSGYLIFRVAKKVLTTNTTAPPQAPQPAGPSPELRWNEDGGEQHISIQDRLLADAELRVRARPDRASLGLDRLDDLSGREWRVQES